MSVKINTKVKKFKVSATNELEINSEELLGKNFVIYFYPKDNTLDALKKVKISEIFIRNLKN